MDDEMRQLWQTLCKEHGSSFVELSRFMGFAKGYYNLSQEEVTFWLLDKIDAGKIHDKLFLGRQYIKFNY